MKNRAVKIGATWVNPDTVALVQQGPLYGAHPDVPLTSLTLVSGFRTEITGYYEHVAELLFPSKTVVRCVNP